MDVNSVNPQPPIKREALSLLISLEAIEKKVRQAAFDLNATYQGRQLMIIGVLKGSICLLSDLIRHLDIPFTLHFLSASSYGLQGSKRGKILVKGLEELEIKDKDILLI